MSTDPVRFRQPPPGLPAPDTGPTAVADLDLARRERGSEEEDERDYVAELVTKLDTERSASRALVDTVAVLEGRLTTERGNVCRIGAQLESERAAAQSLQKDVTELEASLATMRSELGTQRQTNEDMWEQVIALNGELALATRPIWRKLLRRT